MKRFVLLILSILFLGCCDDCQEPEVEHDPTIQEIITELALLGFRVEVEAEEGEVFVDGELFGVYQSIAVKRYALITCDPFGWGSEYDWLCTMTGAKGRALAKQASGTPVPSDVFHYVEKGSEEQPDDMTSITYFSRKTEHYPNYLDNNANEHAFFGLTVAAWGPEWSPALEDSCINTHIPFCNPPKK